MKKALLLAMAIVTISIPAQSQTGLYVPELAAFDSAMLDLINTYDVPGAQLAITYKGRLVYNRGFGLADTAAHDSVYPTSVFRIASVSKTITSLACMQLFHQGLLNLDAKAFGANGILNDSIYQNILDPRDTNITVRMLLHHEGGWNRNVSGDPMFDAYNIATTMGVASPPSPSIVIQYVLSHKMLDFTPGTQSQYSNFGYLVLGRIIEKISGQTYEQFVKTNILNPLGMQSTNLGFNLASNQLPNEVRYYDYAGAPLANSVYDNTTQVPWPYGGFNLEYMDAHGGWVSSGSDLLRFVCAFDKFSTRPDILPAAIIDTMITPSDYDPNYAFGIGVNSNNNWWHMGSLPGTTSEFVRNGNKQINWTILLNTRDASLSINNAVDALVWNVLPSIPISSWPSFDLFDTTTAIQDVNKTNELVHVYPNPVQDKLFIQEIGKLDAYEIFDLQGRLMLKGSFIKEKSIDVKALSNGCYFVKLYSLNGNVANVKFLKE